MGYNVSPDEFYEDFRDVANMAGDRPIVRQVRENARRIRSLEFRFYGILAGLVAGVSAAVALLARGFRV